MMLIVNEAMQCVSQSVSMATLGRKLVIVTGLVSGTAAGVYYWNPSLVVKTYLRYNRYRSGLETKYKTLPDVEKYKICYAERGRPSRDLPSLVLVHGFSGSIDNWTSVVKELPSDQHVIVVDMPGHGETRCTCGCSTVLDNDLNYHGMINRLHEILHEAVVIERPFHLVGQSLGGTFAGGYAAKYPEDVKLLTMIAPGMRSKQRVEEGNQTAQILLGSTTEGLQDAVQLIMGYKPKIPKQMFKGLADLRRPYFEKYWIPLLENMGKEMIEGEQDSCLGASSKAITVPTQVIWGDEDKVCDPSGVEVLQSNLPNCQSVTVLKGVGHFVCGLVPGQLVNLLMGFQRSQQSAVVHQTLKSTS